MNDKQIVEFTLKDLENADSIVIQAPSGGYFRTNGQGLLDFVLEALPTDLDLDLASLNAGGEVIFEIGGELKKVPYGEIQNSIRNIAATSATFGTVKASTGSHIVVPPSDSAQRFVNPSQLKDEITGAKAQIKAQEDSREESHLNNFHDDFNTYPTTRKVKSEHIKVQRDFPVARNTGLGTGFISITPNVRNLLTKSVDRLVHSSQVDINNGVISQSSSDDKMFLNSNDEAADYLEIEVSTVVNLEVSKTRAAGYAVAELCFLDDTSQATSYNDSFYTPQGTLATDYQNAFGKGRFAAYTVSLLDSGDSASGDGRLVMQGTSRVIVPLFTPGSVGPYRSTYPILFSLSWRETQGDSGDSVRVITAQNSYKIIKAYRT